VGDSSATGGISGGSEMAGWLDSMETRVGAGTDSEAGTGVATIDSLGVF